jgi:predicted alpha/beta hydrolase family esterase
MNMMQISVLTLPGWHSSGPLHWQSLWEREYGYRRVEQHDWDAPKRGDWIARLEDVVSAERAPVVLAAHSLGCVLVAAWAAVSKHRARVQGALLVAPGDVEQPGIAAQLPGWQPMVRAPLPFASVLLASRNDPYCGFERARRLAHDWGARFVDYGERGHINADSGLGLWPEGHALLQQLIAACNETNELGKQ